MMNWFFKWVRDGINNIDMDSRANEAKYASDRGMKVGLAIPKVRQKATISPMNMSGEINLNQQAMHFRIYPATGGHIVEYQYYDEKTDRTQQALHLIPSDLDLGENIAKIMTLEAFKR